MKNLVKVFVLLLASFALSAQDKTLILENFSEIDVSGGITVTIYRGAPKAEIDIIKGDLDDLIIEQNGDNLEIKWEYKMSYGNNRKAEIDLYTTSVEDIEASAGARLVSDVLWESNSLDVDCSSGASVSLATQSKTTDVEVSSGASVQLEGMTDKLMVDVSSGAYFGGEEYQSKSANAEASSGASAKIWCTESLEADASSGASIRYKGNPSDKDIDAGKYSGGSIRSM